MDREDESLFMLLSIVHRWDTSLFPLGRVAIGVVTSAERKNDVWRFVCKSMPKECWDRGLAAALTGRNGSLGLL